MPAKVIPFPSRGTRIRPAFVPTPAVLVVGVPMQTRSPLAQVVGLIGAGMGLWAVLAIFGVVR